MGRGDSCRQVNQLQKKSVKKKKRKNSKIGDAIEKMFQGDKLFAVLSV